MKNAIQKNAQQNELPFPSDQVNQEKLNLEIQKLKEEITHLRSRWYLPALIQAAPATLVVLATVAVAWSTGLLDAKRENLSAQNERLQTQSMLLEQQEKEILAEVASLREELQVSKVELNAYRAEEMAIRTVRKLWSDSTIEYLQDEDGFRIQIDGKFHFVVITEGTDGPRESVDDRPKRITDALEAICSMRNVKSLSISNIQLTDKNLDQIGRLDKLKSLYLEKNDLDDEAMMHFPKLTDLESVSFFDERFTEVTNLKHCKKLTSLRFHATPVSAKIFQDLHGLQDLAEIGLHTTPLTDQDIPLLLRFPKLHSLSVEGTAVTAEGIRKLVSHLSLRNLFIPDGLISEGSRSELLKINDRLLLVDSKDAYHFGQRF